MGKFHVCGHVYLHVPDDLLWVDCHGLEATIRLSNPQWDALIDTLKKATFQEEHTYKFSEGVSMEVDKDEDNCSIHLWQDSGCHTMMLYMKTNRLPELVIYLESARSNKCRNGEANVCHEG